MTNCETGDHAGEMSDHYAINSKLKIAAYIPKKNHRKEKHGTHHQDATKKEKKKKIEWYKILSYPDKFQSLLSENIMISKSKTNPKNNNNKDDNINTNIDIDIDYTNNNTTTTTVNTIIVIMIIIIIIILLFSNNNNNNNNNNNIEDPDDRLSKSIKVTAEELFSGEDNIKRGKPWFEFSQKCILEKIKDRNHSFGKYSKEKSISNLTILRNSRSNLKKKKGEVKRIWIASRVAKLENMDVDPRTS